MKRRKDNSNKRKYKRQLLRRILLVCLIFVIMIVASAALTVNMLLQRQWAEAESVVSHAALEIEGVLNEQARTVNVAADAIRTMVLRGEGAQIVSGYLEKVSESLNDQPNAQAYGNLYGYFDAFNGGMFIDPSMEGGMHEAMHEAQRAEEAAHEDEEENEEENEENADGDDEISGENAGNDESDTDDKSGALGQNGNPVVRGGGRGLQKGAGIAGNAWLSFNPKAQPWYIAAEQANGALAMCTVFNSLQTGKKVIACSRRIFDADGSPIGVIALDIPISQLQMHIAELHLSSGSGEAIAFLTNEKSELIAQSEEAVGSGAGGLSGAAAWLENELVSSGGKFIEYVMEKWPGAGTVSCVSTLSNGWTLTLLTPYMDYYSGVIWMVVSLIIIGAAEASILIFMLVRLHKRTLERDAQYDKLAAVAENYKGVVWSVDDNDTLSIIRGRSLAALGVKPSDLEGKPASLANSYLHTDFETFTQKALEEGPQDWVFESGGCSYHSNMAVMYDEQSRPVGVVGSIDDVTEESRLRQQLEAALAEAEIANKAKSSFLANMSHEIRTPMNAILGITEILVQDESLPPDIMEGLTKIYSSGGLLLGIINDVLDFSKIEAGKLDIIPAPYEVASLVNDSVHLNMMRIGSRPIDFTLQIDENIPAKLVGDELRIKQILNNLLSNAFKYTDSGMVTLRVGFTRGENGAVMLELEVQDTGHGMTREQVNKLFDEYTRFQLESTRVIEGTGLGMAITQRLVYLMNGTIRVQSELDKGSLFVVNLPQAAVDGEILGEELAQNLRSFRMSMLANRKRSQFARDPMPYGRVLVVDDVETNIYVAVGLFKLYGLQTDTAMSGAETIAKAEAGNVYDIIFMDHMMPGMDGIEATKRLRALGYSAPIVALTANAVAKQADIFLQNGFDDFIAKPIDIRQLNSILNRLVRDKHPPEVVERARREAQARPQAAGEAKPELDPLLLSSFVRDARKAVAALEQFQPASEEDLRQFTITVHGMKSALANIGESTLSAVAKELEFAGKAGEAARIEQSAPAFLADLKALIERVAPKEDDGGTDDIAALREKLQAVQELCDDYDRKGATAILSEIEKNCSPQTREAAERIMEAILHSEFEEAAEMAREYADGLTDAPPAVGGLPSANPAIEGLDIPRGLEKFGGDEATYHKVLRSYAAGMERLLGQMSDAAGDISGYAIAVHGIKGASRDIFAEPLGESAALLEAAANSGDMFYIEQHDAPFHAAARRLAGDITQMLARLASSAPRAEKEKPDEALLETLLLACETYDMDGVDSAIAQLEAYEYAYGGDLVSWLRERADVTDFSAMAARLREC